MQFCPPEKEVLYKHWLKPIKLNYYYLIFLRRELISVFTPIILTSIFFCFAFRTAFLALWSDWLMINLINSSRYSSHSCWWRDSYIYFIYIYFSCPFLIRLFYCKACFSPSRMSGPSSRYIVVYHAALSPFTIGTFTITLKFFSCFRSG